MASTCLVRAGFSRQGCDRWLCSWGNLNFEGSQGTFSVVQFGRGKDVSKFGESRREGVDGGGVPTRSVQREVYASDVWGNSVL